MILDLLMQLRRFDQNRAGLPGEHLFAAISGVGLIRSGLRSESMLVRAIGLGAGLALLYRAAAGRDGLASLISGRSTIAPSDEASRGALR